MGSSDSESECFESAEESFDEEDRKHDKIKLKNNIQKSDNETSKPVVSDCKTVDSVREVGADTSNSSLSYRKRPERVKRFPSKTLIKPKSKSPTNESVFRADKIVPDVLLQDITSNLSKNLNKSLSTLQQKSSNVKDLILSSLPVSSVEDDEGFSYDDKSIIVSDEKTEFEANHPNENQSIESQEVIHNEKETTNAEPDLITNKEVHSKDDNEQENIVNNNLENESHLENIIETDNLHTENSEKCSPLCIDSDTLQKSSGNTCTETTTIEPSEKEDIIHDESEACLNQEKTELIDDEGGKNNNNNDINQIETVLTEELDQEIAICKNNICIVPSTAAEIKDKEETQESSETSKQKEIDNVQSNQESNKEIIVDAAEEKHEMDPELNLEELKTVLKNIVNEESISVKENKNLEEQIEVQSSGDGWDDFDFSDDEIISSTGEVNSKSKESGDVKTNEVTKCQLPNLGVRSTGTETKKSKALVLGKKNKEETPISTKNVIEKSKNNIVENDSWDWDNWDETPENKVENPTVKKSEIKNNINSSDVSKWSGWDTFGQKPQEKQDNWGLASWGVDALLNKATAVTQGISSVLEAGLGAPDPETLARMEKLERENQSQPKETMDCENVTPPEMPKKNSLTNVNIFPVSGITSLVAGVTSKIVEHSKIQEIGTKVITGGLETLETFGKKTMEVLQEGDPGLKNKRALLLGNNKPVLSQVLREAREKADKESKKVEEKELARKCHFETLFDDFQGMVHLEALEMLSRQCEIKLEQIRSGMNPEEQEDLNGVLEEVEQLCSLDEYDIDMKSSVVDFKTLLQMAVEPLKNEISIQNILQIHEDVNKWLQISSEAEPSFTVINQKLVSTLAELTAATVHQFHKSGELLSVKECRKTVEEVDALSRLTTALCVEINKLGEKFIKLSCNKVSKDPSGDLTSINEKANNVMKNSVFYIKQAFSLLIPVVQLGAAV